VDDVPAERRGPSRRLVLIGVLALIVLALVVVPRAQRVLGGAVPLQLQTAGFMWLSLGGAGVGLPDTRIERDGDTVIFVDVSQGVRRPIAFPWGYSAWLVDGRAELLKPEGTVLAWEGDTLVNFGGYDYADGTFHIDAGSTGSSIQHP
jgi:hypothetical protein